MPMPAHLPALPVLLALLVACGGKPVADGSVAAPDSTSADVAADSSLDASVAGLPLADLAAAYVTARCSRVGRCLDYWATVDGCAAHLKGMPPWARETADVTAGRRHYDAVQAAMCVAGLAADCTWPSACGSMFPPGLDEGGACTDAKQCKIGLCLGLDPNAQILPHPCPGRCGPPRAVGEPCATSMECVKPALCSQGVCVARQVAAEGADCSNSYQVVCADGLHCIDDGQARLCRPLQLQGGPCTWSPHCAAGLHCTNEYSIEPGTCQPTATAGSPCAGPDNPVAKVSGPGACESGFVCTRPPGEPASAAQCLDIAGPGQPCISQAQCAGFDQVCETTGAEAGTCRPLPGLGQPCDPALSDKHLLDDKLWACRPGLQCHGEQKICVTPPGPGEPCLPGGGLDTCADGLHCIEDYCRHPSVEGDPCEALSSYDDPCGTGLQCTKSASGGGTCAKCPLVP